MKQGPYIACGESRLRSALKITSGSLSGGGSLGGVIVMTFWYVFGMDLHFLNFLNFIFTWD